MLKSIIWILEYLPSKLTSCPRLPDFDIMAYLIMGHIQSCCKALVLLHRVNESQILVI